MSTEKQENLETEYLEINSKGAWAILYQHIRNECMGFDYTCNESRKPQNRNLNRYRDVAPYDHTRVELKKRPFDYINANLVEVERANRLYILTQGPLPHTAGHFWLMVWEQESKGIIMLNKVIEKSHVKCHQYWPRGGNYEKEMTFLDVDLKVEFVSKTTSQNYTISTLKLTDLETNTSREVLHFHYTTWPDFGVPQSPTSFLRFLVDVRQHGVLDQNVGPPIVHCSAGIGRSGTFCLVDSCLILIDENGINAVNVREVLTNMRKSRMGLIQTPDQLRFSYAAIIEGSKQLPSNNNFDNEIVTNHYDEVNNVCNSSIDEDDEPPPLPPPRGESLGRGMTADITPSPTIENGDINGPPNKPLPNEPPSHSDLNSTSPQVNSTFLVNNSVHENTEDVAQDGESGGENSSANSDSKSNLRQRHQEKNARLAAQVREMKRRQKESEDWQKLKRSLFSPLSLSIGAAFVGGSVLAIYAYFYMRG